MEYYHEYCDKNETLSKLYTLRVGMSLLSLERDKFVKGIKTGRDKEKAYKDSEARVRERIVKQEKDKKERERELSILECLPVKTKTFGFWFFSILKVIFSFAILVVGICVVYWWLLSIGILDVKSTDCPILGWINNLYIDYENAISKWFALFTMLIGWVNLLSIVLGGIIVIAGGGSILWNISNIVSTVNDESMRPVDILKLKKDIKESNNKINKDKELLKSFPKKLQAELVPVEKKMLEAALDSSVLYQALEQEFSDFLQVVDWGNVDLLIHYFSTGRAYNMKEALQQVDRQRQTDDIVRAVNNASRQICGTITQAFTQLQTSMAQNFVMLSQQLDLMQQQNQAQIAALSNKVKKLASSVAANQELQQKTNVGSLQLAEDIHYLRVSAEIRDIKARNNL